MATDRLMNALGIEYPILQAPIGSMAGVELAAAVTNAGGLGSVALTWTPPENAAQTVHSIRAQTQRPFFVNFVLAFPPASLDAALEAGAPIVTFSWGQPGKLVERVHRSRALVGVQVGTCEGAKLARDAGADFIICQGIEAGGHVQSTIPLLTLVEQVSHECRNLPIIAAGGLADGDDIAQAMKAGADGAMLGTRFVASVESRAHDLYKQALVNATSQDTLLTTCFSGGWPGAVHRVLRNPALDAWEAAGCPPVGARPGEEEVIAENGLGKVIVRYDDTPAASDMGGQLLDCVQYAGLGVGKIHTIRTASELIAELWTGYCRARDEHEAMPKA